jgi:hypothetical protein
MPLSPDLHQNAPTGALSSRCTRTLGDFLMVAPTPEEEARFMLRRSL